jgi:hypothetical protein
MSLNLKPLNKTGLSVNKLIGRYDILDSRIPGILSIVH